MKNIKQSFFEAQFTSKIAIYLAKVRMLRNIKSYWQLKTNRDDNEKQKEQNWKRKG